MMHPSRRPRGWLFWIVALSLSLGHAQVSSTPSERSIDVLIPEVLSIRSDHPAIAFDLSQVDFPPRAFPERYLATSVPDGIVTFEVLASASGAWELQLQIDDLVDAATGATIPARQILFRVDGGPWIRADGTAQVLYAATEPTEGWQPIDVAFALEVTGTEPAGAYDVTSLLSGMFHD
ncbi:MAG: hypothetical protein WD336_01785 [Trueperaceae bacterium]